MNYHYTVIRRNFDHNGNEVHSEGWDADTVPQQHAVRAMWLTETIAVDTENEDGTLARSEYHLYCDDKHHSLIRTVDWTEETPCV